MISVCDRGIEFRDWRKLKPGIGTEAWFCDPQAPWQKGSVAAIFAAGCACRRALKSRYEGDLRPLERHAPKMPGVEDPY